MANGSSTTGRGGRSARTVSAAVMAVAVGLAPSVALNGGTATGQTIGGGTATAQTIGGPAAAPRTPSATDGAAAPTVARAPGTASDARTSRTALGAIVSPADLALRSRAGVPVTVRLQLADRARLAHLRLNGVDVTDRVTVRGRSATARLTMSGPLKGGSNGLLARFVRGGRETIDSSRFILTRNATGLVGIDAPTDGTGRAAGPLPVRVTMKPTATLTAWLNGRRVTGRFHLHADGSHRAELGPGAGLRFGRNTVEVRALAPSGRVQRDTVTVRVGRDGPLADAGPDRRTDTRRPVRLDGRTSVPAPTASGPVTHSWRLTGGPAGARPSLRGATSARPTFASTTPGTYVLTNTTRSGGATSTDRVTVTVSPSALVQPVTMAVGPTASGGTGPGIAVGPQFYPASFAGPGMQLLVLERSSLALTDNQSYAPGQMQQLSQYLVNATTEADSADYLFVLAALPGGSPVNSTEDLTNLVVAVQWLGFALPDPDDPISAIDPDQPFSMVAIPNPVNDVDGTAWHIQAALDGVFVPDVNTNWTFSFGDYLPYDTGATVSGGPAMTLGNTAYPTAVPASGGGFYVVVADAVTLSGSATYYAMPQQAVSMATALNQAAGAGDVVALTSAGTLPTAAQVGIEYAIPYTELALSLRALGGSPSVFLALQPGDSYSLVGPTPAGQYPAEGSTILPGGTGDVTGLLYRAIQGGAFTPMAADPSGNADFTTNIPSIAYQPAQAWPVSSTAEQQAALAYLSQELGTGCDTTPCDVRVEYENLNESGQWTALRATLLDIDYPRCVSGSGADCQRPTFSAQTFDQVRGQLALEFPMVDQVWQLVANLQEPYTQTQGASTTALQQAANAVADAVNPQPETTSSTVLSLLTDVMWALSLVDAEAFAVYATVAGVLAVMAATGNDLATLPSGSPYQATAEAGPPLTGDIVNHTASTVLGMGLLGSFVVQDWGRLSAVAAQTGGAWQIETTTQDAIASGAVNGAVQTLYSLLMPFAYDAYSFTPSPGPGQSIGQCQPTSINAKLPWEGADGNGAFGELAGVGLDGQPAPVAWFALWEVGKSPTYWAGPTGAPPPSSLVDPLYEPFSYDQPGNAGMYAPWFWGRTYLTGQPTPTVLSCTYRS